MGRSVLAVVLGLLLGVVVISLVESVSSRLYPLPEGLEPSDAQAFKTYISTLPSGAFLFVLLGWGLGSFGGGWLSALIARGHRVRHGLITGGVLMLAGVATLVMIPHPAWFWITALFVFLPPAYLGSRLAGRGREQKTAG